VIRIEAKDRVFCLTGAGVSAESGLATFRGAGGLWRNYRVEEVASPAAWSRDARLVWEFYSMRRNAAAAAKPNAGHAALAGLERSLGERLFLCTQNVDRLHEQAGSQRVAHMHGELFKSRCERCAEPPFDDPWTLAAGATLRRCRCGGLVRPHICWFGEIPYGMERIGAELARCTMFFAIGTSGVVQPAASFAAIARGNGARAFYVGPEEPANTNCFDELLVGKAGEVLPGLFEVSG
jgi:NAD-dependent protein deacetylase/lipoamidase